MSDSGQKDVGRPDAKIEGGFFFYQYCGGSGGGGCITPLGVTGVVLAYRLPKFIVRNRRIIFENKAFFGIRIFNDAGADFFCPNTLGTEQGFYMALSADGQLTDAQVVAKGQFITGALPYDIEFLGKDMPQPVGGDWLGYIFVHIYWGNTAYLNEGSNPITENALRIKKHDYDIQL